MRLIRYDADQHARTDASPAHIIDHTSYYGSNRDLAYVVFPLSISSDTQLEETDVVAKPETQPNPQSAFRLSQPDATSLQLRSLSC